VAIDESRQESSAAEVDFFTLAAALLEELLIGPHPFDSAAIDKDRIGARSCRIQSNHVSIVQEHHLIGPSLRAIEDSSATCQNRYQNEQQQI
jgi:hypothetical protein